MAIGFNEIILSMLFLIPNTESQQVLQQHKVSFIEQQSKYINYSEAYNTYLNNIEKKRIEEERQKELARKAEQKKLQEIKKKELKTKEDKVERVNRGRTFTLTFYTDLPEENGGYKVKKQVISILVDVSCISAVRISGTAKKLRTCIYPFLCSPYNQWSSAARA